MNETHHIPMEISPQLNQLVDEHLSRGEVLVAIREIIKNTQCGIAEAKETIGQILRDRFPEQYDTYRNIEEDE